MTKPHLTTNRDRLSKKFKTLHRQLAAELKQPEPEPSKVERKRQASQDFRSRGE